MGSGKIAVVTGCAGSIGSVTVKKLLEDGFRVVGIGRGELSDERMKDFIDNEDFAYIQYDLNDIDGMPALMEEAASKFGGIDAFFNNAATSCRGPIDDVTQEEWDSFTHLNLKGVLFLTQAAIPYLRKQGGGSIVNMSTLRTTISDGRHLVYAMVKGAITTMTRELAISLSKDHIRVNCISPCYVLTPMTRHNLSREGWLEMQLNSLLIDRMVAPEDVAEMALFLLSDRSAAITGQDLVVDGGSSVYGV